MSAAVDLARPYAVPQASGRSGAIVLAVLMHLLLGGLLFFGIRWQSSPPETIQAELWSAVPQVAAPAPRPVPPPPRVEVPTPQPRIAPEPPQPKADIVEAPVKIEPPKKKKEPVKVDEVKPVVKPQTIPQPKPQPPPTVPPKVNAELLKLQQQAAVEAPQRPPSDLASIMASASDGVGKDRQTSGPRGSDSYKARLVTAIRSQMRYPGTSPGNPVASLRIEQLPNGEVTSVTLVRSSGVPAFDAAVERAIRAASPLPRDEHGKVERDLSLDYNMYEK